MERFFIKDYTGNPFVLFGTGHVLFMAGIAAVCLSMLYFRNIWDENARKNFRYGLAAFILIAELAWQSWCVYYGEWSIQTNLPLHLCSIFAWLSIIMLITKSYSIYELAYFLGIGGALQAVITPDAGIYGLPHFRAVQTLAGHGAIILAALYMTWVEGYRPTWKSFKRVFIWTNIYVVFVFFINLTLGSNYLFVAHKPEFPTLLDVLAPWPWYILEVEVIALAICLLLYLPYMIQGSVTQKEPTAAQRM